MTTPTQSIDEARTLILEYGWNSTCYQLLNLGIEHWWSADRRAFVGFVRSGRMAIVAGSPVCARESLESTQKEWEGYVTDQGLQVCYFGAEARLQKCLAESPDYLAVILGCQPEWRPEQFVSAIENDRSLRAQLNRAKNKGIIVTEWSREKAENNPDLKSVLQEWLESRGLPTLHFLVEPETLGDLRDRRVFVAEAATKPVGFVTLCPIPAQNGWLTEQFVRGHHAPNGTVELMLYRAAQAIAESRAEYFTMGIVPLLSSENSTSVSEPFWLNMLRRWAKAHYIRFYNFKGLSEFKAKFHPHRWQPVVVIVKDDRFRFWHLRSIGSAFTGGLPELALGLGVIRALREEVLKLAQFVSLPPQQKRPWWIKRT